MAKGKKRQKGDSFPQRKKAERSSIWQKVDDIFQRRGISPAFLAVLFLVALVVRLFYLKYYQSPLTGDALVYAKIAWGIKNGHGLHWWSVVWPPFYPFMIVIFSIFTSGLETAASAVSLILGSLLVVPFFFVTKSIFNHRVAYLGSILVVFFPGLVMISDVPLSEATYTFFLLITLLCSWRLFMRRSYLWAFLFGILSGACYLTRPEFLAAFASLLLLHLIIELKTKNRHGRKALLLLTVSILGFLILAFPYIIFMHSQTGHWILSGKTAHNVLKEKAYDQGVDYSGQREALARVLDGLTPEGEFKGKVLLGERSMFSFLKTPGFFGSYFRRIWLGIEKVNFFILPFLLFSLFYLFYWKPEKEGLKKRLFLLFWFAPLLTMPVFFAVAGRLIDPYAPIVIIMAVAGLLNLMELIAGSRRTGSSKGKSLVGFLAVLLVVGLLSVFSVSQANQKAQIYQRVFQTTKYGATEFRKLGLWADRVLPKDAVVMCLSQDTFLFYCNRQTFPVPFAGWEEIVRFARTNGIGYLLVSVSMEATWREDLAFLMDPIQDRSKAPSNSYVKLVDTYRAPSGLGAVLYEFEFEKKD
jgi:4-amino-4-deoxy-L-arabinose transferase-like glycosyltransferase